MSLVLSRDWKKFGNRKCNERLVRDLKKLEREGINVEKPVAKNIKAGLLYIIGDNLGKSEENFMFSFLI